MLSCYYDKPRVHYQSIQAKRAPVANRSQSLVPFRCTHVALHRHNYTFIIIIIFYEIIDKRINLNDDIILKVI